MEKNKLNQNKRTLINWEFFAKEGDQILFGIDFAELYSVKNINHVFVIEKIIKSKVPLLQKEMISFIIKNKTTGLIILDVVSPDHIIPMDYETLVVHQVNSLPIQGKTFEEWMSMDTEEAVQWYVGVAKKLNKKDVESEQEIREIIESYKEAQNNKKS